MIEARKAADQLADCFNKLVISKRPGGPIAEPVAQRFILQMLVALFAEDIGLLHRYIVTQLLERVQRNRTATTCSAGCSRR